MNHDLELTMTDPTETARALLYRHDLDRIREVVDRLVAHAVGFQDVLDESDCGPWGKTVGADIAELRRLTAAPRPATAVDQTSPSRRAALRDEIAAALEAADYRPDMRRGDLADAVLPVLYRAWPWLRAEAEDAEPALSDAAMTDLLAGLPGAAGMAAAAQAVAEAQQPETRGQDNDRTTMQQALPTAEDPSRRAVEVVSRVTALYEQWVQAGVPPIGTPIARWVDRRLAELHAALHPDGDR
jgi:hypothetical protein